MSAGRALAFPAATASRPAERLYAVARDTGLGERTRTDLRADFVLAIAADASERRLLARLIREADDPVLGETLLDAMTDVADSLERSCERDATLSLGLQWAVGAPSATVTAAGVGAFVLGTGGLALLAGGAAALAVAGSGWLLLQSRRNGRTYQRKAVQRLIEEVRRDAKRD